MFERGKRYDFEGTAERDGATLEIAGTFECVAIEDGYAILRDARHVDGGAEGIGGHDAALHTYKVAT